MNRQDFEQLTLFPEDSPANRFPSPGSAEAKMMERAAKITGIDITPIYEEEMRKARIENEKEGIFFPADDPDVW